MEYRSKAVCTKQWFLDISLKDDYKDFLYNYLLRAGIKDVDRDNVLLICNIDAPLLWRGDNKKSYAITKMRNSF